MDEREDTMDEREDDVEEAKRIKSISYTAAFKLQGIREAKEKQKRHHVEQQPNEDPKRVWEWLANENNYYYY